MSKKRAKPKTSRSAVEGDVGAADLDALKSFAESVLQDASQPDIVRSLAESLQKVIDHSKNVEAKSSGTIDTLKRSLALSMGITPSSERAASIAEDARGSLSADVDEEALVREKLNRARQVRRFAGRAEARLKALLDKIQADKVAQDEEGSCDPGGPNETDASSASRSCENETVFSPGVVLDTGATSSLGLPIEQARANGCIMGDVTRSRNDLALVRTRVEMHGKTVFDPRTGERFDYDFSLVGPPGSCFTWRACLFVVIHVIGQAAPLARVERMLNGKPFTRQNMHRIIGYVAKIGLPVYLRLAQELAQADVLCGDDTHSRVVEVAKALRAGKEPWAEEADPPLAGSAERRSADHDPGRSSAEETEPESGNVFRATVEDLGYRFPKVKHPGRYKDQHVTSCLHGQVDGKSRIVFYRSHLGSLGNLLERVLLMRSAKHSQVTVVADLSSANRVRDPALLAKVSIAYAGCSAHARRPFYRYAPHRLEDCLEILDYFKMNAIIEDMIKADTPKERLRLRSRDEHSEQYFWGLIKTKCEELSLIFSDQTPLGKAARYVLRNYDALTMYLNTSNLPADNNLSERLLRIERLTERNTYGSKTIEGRTRLDILRTLLTTCRYAELDEAIYLLKLMITPPNLIEANPENYTPSAIKALLAANPAEREQLENILHTQDIASLVKPSSNYQRKANQPT